jgi:hypothetical protein
VRQLNACLLFAGQGSGSATGQYMCYSGWQMIQDTSTYSYDQTAVPVCVKKSNLSASWSQALASCRSYGAHLLVIDRSFYAGMSSTATDVITQGIYNYIVQYPGDEFNRKIKK